METADLAIVNKEVHSWRTDGNFCTFLHEDASRFHITWMLFQMLVRGRLLNMIDNQILP